MIESDSAPIGRISSFHRFPRGVTLLATCLTVVVLVTPVATTAQELKALSGHVGGVVQSIYAPGGKVYGILRMQACFVACKGTRARSSHWPPVPMVDG